MLKSSVEVYLQEANEANEEFVGGEVLKFDHFALENPFIVLPFVNAHYWWKGGAKAP